MNATISAVALAAALLAAQVSLARAQGAPPGSPMEPGGPVEGQQPQGGGYSEAPAGPPTLEDVRINFPTIVQAFIDKRSVDGVWPLRDKQTGKMRKLTVVTIKANEASPEGPGLYAAPVVLADASANNERLTAVFTVNFSGAEWAVEKMRFLKTKPQARAKKKTAR